MKNFKNKALSLITAAVFGFFSLASIVKADDETPTITFSGDIATTLTLTHTDVALDIGTFTVTSASSTKTVEANDAGNAKVTILSMVTGADIQVSCPVETNATDGITYKMRISDANAAEDDSSESGGNKEVTYTSLANTNLIYFGVDLSVNDVTNAAARSNMGADTDFASSGITCTFSYV